MIEFVIDLDIKSDLSTNAIYKGGHWGGRNWKADMIHSIVHYTLAQNDLLDAVIDKPVRIELYFNTGLDCSNHSFVAKCIEDALKGHLIVDDTRKYVQGMYMGFWDGKGVKVRLAEA